MSTRRIDQDMARAAAAALTPASELSEQQRKTIRTRYRTLGAMLHSAGLAATYAYIAAKSAGADRDPLAEAYRKTALGIRERLDHVGLLPAHLGPQELLAELGKMNAVDYARASAEAAALTRWLSRLADATYQESTL